MRAQSCLCRHPGHTPGSQDVDFGSPRDNQPHCPGVPKGPVPTPGVTGTHPLLSHLCSQVQTRKEQRAKLGKGSEQLKVGIKEMSRKISYSCIYTPAQPSKAGVMQPRVSEYVMNISPDFGTQQNPTRREGLNLAAGTQKICHFITRSLQKMYPHAGIGRPSQVNLIILFFSGV